VSLVSPEEAESFAPLACRPVHSLPMSVAIPDEPWRAARACAGMGLFMGGLDYKPNLDALVYYQQSVFPAIQGTPGVTPTLVHIGNAPAELRRKLRPEAVRCEGYVPDVAGRLRNAAFFVAPVRSGTGIKTKVLEAMAIGLPLIATPHAVAGLSVEHGRHCLICERPAQFAEAMLYLRTPEAAEAMGAHARRYVEANFSVQALQGRWKRVLQDLGAR
jgi:glycosyltransferase involved in cell wall biosynthesis